MKNVKLKTDSNIFEIASRIFHGENAEIRKEIQQKELNFLFVFCVFSSQ